MRHLKSVTAALIGAGLTLTLSSCVVAGEDAYAEDWPGIVSIQVQQGRQLYHQCGGTLIAPDWVLTAAHCVSNAQMNDQSRAIQYERDYETGETRRLGPMRIIAGQTSLADMGEAPASDVAEIIIHEAYRDEAPETGADIALLRLATPIDGPTATLATATSGEELDDEYLTYYVAGYGKLDEAQDLNDAKMVARGRMVSAPSLRLQQAELPAVETAACTTAIRSIAATYDLGEPYMSFSASASRIICAGGQGQDSCQGDSGGPLQRYDENGYPVQVGIVSWGLGCGREGIPGIYTDVAQYIDWIKDETGLGSET